MQEKDHSERIRALADLHGDSTVTVIFACGITDPHEDRSRIMFSNYEFPKMVSSESLAAGNTRYLTIGTIQETVDRVCSGNAYLESKQLLGKWVANTGARFKSRFLHLRLHTLYGYKIKRHMFLGQLLDCLKRGTVFKMSAGTQLREYHWVGDVTGIMKRMLENEWTFGPVEEISNGGPTRLVDLARGICKAFGREDLLSVGAIDAPPGEDCARAYKKSDWWGPGTGTDAVTRITEILKSGSSAWT